MHAVLLAGGKGTRLRPYTAHVPKALLPINGVPVIELLIGQLRDQGVQEYTVVVGHMAEQIQKQLGSGARLGVEIHYVRETEPLDTAGCLGLFTPSTEPFLFVNADIMTDFPFLDLAKFHARLGSVATVAIARHHVKVDFGVVQCDVEGRMLGYVEKPSYDLSVSMGIYCLDPRVCDFVTRGERISMPDLLLRLCEAGEVVRCYRANCYWRDIGRPDDYAQAKQDLAELPQRFSVRRAA